jgi:hypothetical protein
MIYCVSCTYIIQSLTPSVCFNICVWTPGPLIVVKDLWVWSQGLVCAAQDLCVHIWIQGPMCVNTRTLVCGWRNSTGISRAPLCQNSRTTCAGYSRTSEYELKDLCVWFRTSVYELRDLCVWAERTAVCQQPPVCLDSGNTVGTQGPLCAGCSRTYEYKLKDLFVWLKDLCVRLKYLRVWLKDLCLWLQDLYVRQKT